MMKTTENCLGRFSNDFELLARSKKNSQNAFRTNEKEICFTQSVLFTVSGSQCSAFLIHKNAFHKKYNEQSQFCSKRFCSALPTLKLNFNTRRVW